MNRIQYTLQGFGLLLAIGLISQQTLAGFCQSGIRTFPSVVPSLDSTNLSCNNNTVKGLHTAQIDGLGKKVGAKLTLGANNNSADTFAVDPNTGFPTGTCAILDHGPVDGNGATSSAGCATAVRWRARLDF